MSREFEITEELIARQTPEAQAIIRVLLAQIAKLSARVEELESRLGKTPQNSSRPPSSQHPHAKLPQAKAKSKKRRGGQPGHQKHERPLIPTNQCDEVETLRPTECRRCGERLRGSDPDPLRHQVWELPEITPHVTEYQRHRLECPCDRHPLSLAARKLCRPVIEPLRKTDAVEQLLGVLRVDVGGDAVGQKRHQHVFEHGALRQQMVLLEHEADLPAAQVCERGFVEFKRLLAR